MLFLTIIAHRCFSNNIAATDTKQVICFVYTSYPLSKYQIEIQLSKNRSHLHPQIHFPLNELSSSQLSLSFDEKWLNDLEEDYFIVNIHKAIGICLSAYPS